MIRSVWGWRNKSREVWRGEIWLGLCGAGGIRVEEHLSSEPLEGLDCCMYFVNKVYY
jgi:hypothetical protein